MRKLAYLAVFATVALGTTIAHAQVPDLTEAPIESIMDLVEDMKEGNWRLVAGFVLTALMVLLNKGRDRVKWFKGDRGGAVLVLTLALAGSLSLALYSDEGMSVSLIFTAISVAFTSAGGYTVIKKIIWPKDDEESVVD